MRADRAALVSAAGETIRKGSKSFHLSSRLFDRATRERAWLLYAWCRACDDVADGQVLGHDAVRTDGAQQRLSWLRVQTARALAGEWTGETAFDALGAVAAECRIPQWMIDDHLEGFAMDARDWRPRSEADLLQYCYHVAGAVGCMMAVVMGVDPEDRDTLNRASDLGIAFQLANIARDMSEDDAVGRNYLPVEWMVEMDVSPGQHMKPMYRERMGVIARRLAALAAEYEASARVGAARLPFRSRWAVLAAANIYGEIAREVAKRGAHAWDYRVVIPRPKKVALAAQALQEARREPKAADREGLWTRPMTP
ncbi:phytoene/squalene synthase family protein [Allosphingosinicella indica]|uniref:Phytoene synthase n=1 Tax=Allosphingosinicella indica TaxID=941907 RepID=A0A1X7G805_9SPHN|nr:phytoene/squalene synthase family protein [Allosphingosinicella indica]SMF65582.1 phytoene synthase [Allosphingosinicella indica]